MELFAPKKTLLCRRFFLIAFSIVSFFSLLLAQNPSDSAIKTIQYRSQKITKHQKESVATNLVVYLADGNVKIEYLSPEKRTLLLVGETVYVYGETKEDLVSYQWAELPVVVRSMLQPTIFAAADFMDNINNDSFKIKKTTKKSGAGVIYEAVSKEQKNISKIEYVYDADKELVYSYKIISKEGAVISEVYFMDYKIYNERYYFPSSIKTIINSAEGLIEDLESFSRVRVNAAVDNKNFEI